MAVAASPFGVGNACAQTDSQGPPKAPATDAPVVMPQITVRAFVQKYCPPFPKADVTPPGISEKEPPLDYMMTYPGKAYADGIPGGRASVGVMLDANGKPDDFLLIRYSQTYFGDELMRQARDMTYTPLRIKGTAIPGRFNVGYQFSPQLAIKTNAMFDLINERFNVDIDGGQRFIYEPHSEQELDGGQLQSSRSAVPLIPTGYTAARGNSPRPSLVTFYVDETGRVRLPNVESAESPLLIPNAIKAIRYWQFRPPTLRGHPVLVFAARALPYQGDSSP